jgi:succinate dehydrogenase (ubiquinone) flavoprotein subunit
VETLETINILTCAVQSAQSALESHAREDYQERDDVNSMKHSLSWQTDVGDRIEVGYRSVVFDTLNESECRSVPAKKRSY